MSEELTRRTISLDFDAEKALERIRRRDTVRKKKPKVSAAVRKALINEAQAK